MPIKQIGAEIERAEDVRRYIDLAAVDCFAANLWELFEDEEIVPEGIWEDLHLDEESTLMRALWPEDSDIDTPEFEEVNREAKLLAARLFIHAAANPGWFAGLADRFVGATIERSR